jgi:cell division protein FtsZ
VSSPLLEASIEGAHGVLLSIAGGSDLGLFEVSAAANLIQGAAHEDANIIFGTVIDDALGDEVRVTVIAAGFEGGQPPRRQPGISRAADLRTHQARPTPTSPEPEPAAAVSHNHSSANHAAPAESPAPALHPSPVPLTPTRVTVPPRAPTFEDDLDVPDFLK